MYDAAIYRPPPSLSFDLADLDAYDELEQDEQAYMLLEAHELIMFWDDILREMFGFNKGKRHDNEKNHKSHNQF